MKFTLTLNSQLFNSILLNAVKQEETMNEFITIAIQERIADIIDIEQMYTELNKKELT